MRAIGYLRCSTEEQATSGLGLEAQEDRVRGFAKLYDLELVDVIVDAGVSAKTLERPGLARALERLRRGGADALLVAKLDRLTRSVADLGKLIDKHFSTKQLISVAEQVDTRSAGGRLVLNVLMSVAQWEREAIAERTSAALQAKKRRGERVGGIPFGYRLAGAVLLEERGEQAALMLMKTHRELGQSFGAIARTLAERGYPCRGSRWRPQSVKTILESAARRSS